MKETLAEVGNLEQRRLSGLRQERDDLLRMLHKKRKLISVKHANAKRAEVKRISVMVDKLQKAILYLFFAPLYIVAYLNTT